ncbi:MAG: rRNA maturation RNase YbeY [Anaerolineaceae bacterium]|nr:rRNA maturation RNase YbeY [Anaerolineaceae bacterium]
MLEIKLPNFLHKKISLPSLQKAADLSLEACGYSRSERITLRITTNKVIRKYNKQFRGLDEPTDVLSFENDYTDPEDGSHVVGDLLISYEKAASQAEAGGHTAHQELEMLLVHGVLHLCGHDHEEKKAYEKMSALQDEVLASLGNPLRKSIHKIV